VIALSRFVWDDLKYLGVMSTERLSGLGDFVRGWLPSALVQLSRPLSA
jgi:hypothetical protein